MGRRSPLVIGTSGIFLFVLMPFTPVFAIGASDARKAEHNGNSYTSRLIIMQDNGTRFVYYTNGYRYEADHDAYVLVMKTGKWLLDEKSGAGLEFNELRLTVPRRLSITIQPFDGAPR